MNWYREDQSDMISLENEDIKTEYTMKEVDDQLSRVRTFRGEEASDELVKQQIETTREARVNDIQIVEEMIDVNPATYMLYAWQWDSYQNMLYLGEDLEVNLHEIIAAYSEEVQQIFNKFDEIVSKGPHDIENYLTIEYAIRLMTDVSVVGKIGYHIPKEHKWIEEQVKIMIENRVIEKSNSLYAFNIIVVEKKDSAGKGIDRLCVNYKLLNKITISDRYSLPNINKTCSRFWRSRWFISLDLASAYWQV